MQSQLVKYPVHKLRGPLLRWALDHYQLYASHPELSAMKPKLRLLLGHYLLEVEKGQLIEVPAHLLPKRRSLGASSPSLAELL